MEHLQGMGDANACVGRLGYVGSDVLLAASAVYQHAYGTAWAEDYEDHTGEEPVAGEEYPEEEDDPEFMDETSPLINAESSEVNDDNIDEITEDGNTIIGSIAGATADSATSDIDQYEDDSAPTIPCSFQSIYMIGWKHHDSQQQPLLRGSAERSLKEIASFSSDNV